MMKNYLLGILISMNLIASAQVKTANVKNISQEIVIDGVIDEAAWMNAEVLSNFIQNFPTDSLPAESNTEVRLMYDNKNLYVSAVCHQKAPYVVNNLVRDYSFPVSDAFAIFLSPRRDETNGFSFSVNPYGAQREGIVTNGGGFGVTTAWDQKWFAAATRIDGAYIVEMAIPFKALRYEQDAQMWDVNFARNDLSLNEQSTWAKVELGFNVATLTGIGQMKFESELPKAGSNIALLPYMSFGGLFGYEDGSIESRENISKAGLDAKIAVTSSLNLDVTVNPDFSNVQVDEQVINLDRFSIFFPERRNFFTENSDLFANFGFSRIRPFFSRRIGISDGEQVNILGGLRLSGNVSDELRVGVMNMQTEGRGGNNQLESQNFSVAAFQQQVFGRSNIGAILVHKQAFNGFNTIKGQNNTTAGVDFNLYSNNNKWRGKIFYHQNFDDGVELDGGAQAVWLGFNNTNWNFNYNHEYVGSNYNAEVGFVPRIGYFRFEHNVRYSWYPEQKEKINRQSVETYYSQYWTDKGFTSDRFNGLEYNLTFQNTSRFGIGVYDQSIQLSRDFDVVNKGTPIEAGKYNFRNFRVNYASNFRKAFTYNANLEFGSFYNGNRLRIGIGADYRIRPWASLGLNFERNELRFPTQFQDGFLTLIGANINVSFSTKVIWNNFIQYNTQANNFNINSRLQWRFAPQSDIFFVYTDNYTDSFQPKNKAIILRINYWFGI